MWMFYVVFLAIVVVIGGQSHGDGRHPLPPDASLNRLAVDTRIRTPSSKWLSAALGHLVASVRRLRHSF